MRDSGEREAHTSLGDVTTLAELFATVQRQIAEQRGLKTWEQLAVYAGEEWYPSRIAFGKHKGKSLANAGQDAGLREWLEELAKSANERNARMGRWYCGNSMKRGKHRCSWRGRALEDRLMHPSWGAVWWFM